MNDSLSDGGRNPVIHDRGPSHYPGYFQITEDALKAYGVSREFFGTTEVVSAGGAAFRVKDYQYVLRDGSIGMTFLPVNDSGAARGPDGEMVYGSLLVDEFLRREMQLKADDPIYALTYFIHPEINRGSILDFAKNDKIQFGITHMGAYLGGGRTSNAPPLYHNLGWGVLPETGNAFGYPANVAIFSVAGVDQAILNKNLCLVDSILNCGVRFPVEYKDSQFRPIDINTALMFYRDWVSQAHYLRTDVSWLTYCGAHKAIVANVGVNLPHNLESFKEVYGDAEGAEFFNVFSDFHFSVFGAKFTDDRQTKFEPLWKKQGLTPGQIRPFTLAEYTAWDAARRSGALAGFDGFKPLAPEAGTPWAPQTTADIVYEWVQSYAHFKDAGPIALCATICGFVGPITKRMGISALEYLLTVMPIAQDAMYADARVKAAREPGRHFGDSEYYKTTFTTLNVALGGQDEDLLPAMLQFIAAPSSESLWERIKRLIGMIFAVLSKASGQQPGGVDQAKAREVAMSPTASPWDRIRALIETDLVPEMVAWLALERVREGWDSIMTEGAVSVDQAYLDFTADAQDDFAKARDVVVRSPQGIQYNTPPSMLHMIGIGMFPCNPLVSVKPVLTVMNYTELEKKTA